ncbi:hypothetical protein [Nocardia niwae]|uniref:hypothetical protein n=1 Tax=Nocardia niwae TaxID=626084 RepID=UPI0007A47AC6|nr:hypothetical protein [Nocardia niwae]
MTRALFIASEILIPVGGALLLCLAIWYIVVPVMTYLMDIRPMRKANDRRDTLATLGRIARRLLLLDWSDRRTREYVQWKRQQETDSA